MSSEINFANDVIKGSILTLGGNGGSPVDELPEPAGGPQALHHLRIEGRHSGQTWPDTLLDDDVIA